MSVNGSLRAPLINGLRQLTLSMIFISAVLDIIECGGILFSKMHSDVEILETQLLPPDFQPLRQTPTAAVIRTKKLSSEFSEKRFLFFASLWEMNFPC